MSSEVEKFEGQKSAVREVVAGPDSAPRFVAVRVVVECPITGREHLRDTTGRVCLFCGSVGAL